MKHRPAVDLGTAANRRRSDAINQRPREQCEARRNADLEFDFYRRGFNLFNRRRQKKETFFRHPSLASRLTRRRLSVSRA